MIIAIDFDGTCVTHEYPEIGSDIGAVPVIRALVNNGHKIILWTMRTHNMLDNAVQWFTDNGIPLFGVNENPTQKSWSDGPKVYANIYIDDAAFGCPLVHGSHSRPFVDWSMVKCRLEACGII